MTQPLILPAPAAAFIPDGVTLDAALARTRIIGIGAHQDDLEIMAYPGILAGYRAHPPCFLGITCTDGAGSPRQGPFGKVTDEQMQSIRWEEQNQAAAIGHYSAMIQLKVPSKAAKNARDTRMADALATVLGYTRVDTIYTHNLMDKHDTHVAVALRTLEALRRLPSANRPRRLIGMEVWRSLDWLPDPLKALFPVDAEPHLAPTLLGVFDSQIGGGKRYDLAVPARWRANATYQESHATDAHQHVTIGIDMTPLIQDSPPSVEAFVETVLSQFKNDIADRLARLS